MSAYADSLDFALWCIGLLCVGFGVRELLYALRNWTISINIYPKRGNTGKTQPLAPLEATNPQLAAEIAKQQLTPTVRVTEAYTGRTERIEVQE